MNGFAEASSPWFWVFWVGCCLSALGCFAFGLNWGRQHGPRAGLEQVGLFALIVAFFFGLESFGEVRIPFYVYSPDFPDSLTPIDFDRFRPDFPPPIRACQSMVNAYTARFPLALPLSIPLMEASLTFAALWTARLLGARPVVQPIVGGLAMLLADSVIDPILTTSFTCPTSGTGALQLSGTLGLWKWHGVPDAPDRDALGPDWFGIPLVNYAIWFAGPVTLIALITLVQTLIEWWRGDRSSPFDLRTLLRSPNRAKIIIGFAVVICISTGLIIFISPALTKLPVWTQRVLFYGAVLVSYGYLVDSVMQSPRNERVRVGIVFPQMFFLLLPVAYLLGTGLFRQQPALLLTAAFFVPLGLFVCWSPYGCAIKTYQRVVSRMDGYLRLRYLSYSSLLIFLGAASTAPTPSTPVLAALLFVALGFNTHSFLVNDVLDLRVDRTQPRRQHDPQVRGEIPPEYSVTIALVLVPLIFLVTWLLDGGRRAHAALLAALACMAIYNVWGKRFPLPPVTDLIQGIAWGSLAIYGAELAGGRTTAMTWLVAAYGAGFMFLINGVHGGLRDLENDLRHEQRTTAIYFGAQPDGKGGAVSTRSLRVFGIAAHAALMLVLVSLASVAWSTADRLIWVTVPATIAAGVASVLVNQQVVAERSDDRDVFVTFHLLVALLPLVAVAMPVLSPLMRVVVTVTFFGSILFVQPVPYLRSQFLEDRVAPTVNPRSPARASAGLG